MNLVKQPIVSNDEIDLNTLRPRQNGHHFSDDTFKRSFLNVDVKIVRNVEISLKLVPKFQINKQYYSMDSDNGLASTRQQAII